MVKEEVPEDLDFEKERKPSFLSKLKNFTKSQRKKAPVTFNVGIAIILFFIYLSVTFVSIPTFPQLLLVLVPTMYILLRYIKLERDTYDEEKLR